MSAAAFRILSSAVLCILVTAACDETPTGPLVALNQQFTLAVGERASIEGVRLSVEFAGVSGDSRCPVDAVCILGGDALVHIKVAGDRTLEYELHSGDASRASATHDSFRIALIELRPFPFSGRTVPQSEYRATLSVTRK